MSSGEVRRVSREDIQLVQNLIERCLQLYMNQKEVVETLLAHAKIEPGFTELVWQKLEEENREFFKAYHVRLTVKNQIMIFNKLLGEQAELMRNTCPVGVGSVPMSNGSNPPSLHQAGSFMSEQRMQPSRSENVNHLMGPSNMAVNGRPSVHGSLQSSDESSAHNGRMGISTNMLLAQNSHMSMPHGLNQIVIKSETGYSNSSPFTFGLNGNILDTRSTIGESFSSVGSNSQPLNPPLVDTEASSFGFLGQIPRNFSLSDLTADFSQSTDIMESYSRSPFLPDADDFLNSPGRNCQDDAKILDTISEGLNFEEFGSD